MRLRKKPENPHSAEIQEIASFFSYLLATGLLF